MLTFHAPFSIFSAQRESLFCHPPFRLGEGRTYARDDAETINQSKVYMARHVSHRNNLLRDFK